MPWQQLVADVALEVQSEAAGDPAPGEWAYNDVTLTVQRQAGKTALLVPVAVHRMGAGPNRSVFSTAQKRDKARARWLSATKDVKQSILTRDAKRNIGVGHELLEWLPTGSTWVPFAPNEEDMHGESPDLVVVDELWSFDHHQAGLVQEAYVPGFATKDAQAWKMSTAGTDQSWWLNTARRDGRKAVDADVRLGTAYFEWSLPDRVDGRRLRSLSDEQLIEACIEHNPALGYTLRPSAVRLAWQQMGGDRAKFLRAWGNRSAEDVASKWQAVDEAEWLASIDGSSIPASARVAFGVWVDEDGEDAAVAAAWRDPAGVMHTEHLHLQDGIRGIVSWVQDSAERNAASVAISNVGASRDVADELHEAGVEVQRVSQADVKAAVSRHRSELASGSWKSAIATVATSAAEAATLERGVWARPGDSVSALGAQTMAGWGIDHAPAPKRRKLVIR